MRRRIALLILLGLTTAACASEDQAPIISSENEPTEIRLMTHDSFAASKPLLDAFTRRTGITIRVVASGDAGAAVNQAVLTKGKPLGDVFFGVDNTFLSRALAQDLFIPYRSPAMAEVDARFDVDSSQRRVTPVDHGAVCVNYDKNWFTERGIEPPARFEELVRPEYRGLLVVENPATSSPGLAFLLATVAEFGEDPSTGWRSFWSKLRKNDVLVVPGWNEAYATSFSGSSGKGPRPLVVSYASSPPAEVTGTDPLPTEAPTAVMEDTCFRQIEFAGILRGTTKEIAARQVIDFLLSPEFQADVPAQMYVFPVRKGTPLPEAFAKFAAQPATPLDVPADRIGANRERWITEWSMTVLQ